MGNFLQGFLGTGQAGVEARNDVTVFIKNWWANRNPLVTRLGYVPTQIVTYQSYNHPYRSQSTTLNGALSSSGTTSITLADNSFLMNGDVLQFVDNASSNTEYVQLTADPGGSNVVTVTRGVAGTTAQSSYGNGSTVNLITNARSGSAVAQTGLSTVGTLSTNYAQTFQFPVQIGGSAQTALSQVMPGGIQSPLDFNMTMQLQNMVDSIERAFYYGKPQAPNDGTGAVAMTMGIQSALVSNNTSSPASASAYTSNDLIRDTLQSARTGGGEPDLLIVSTNFMSAFALWGQAVQRIPAGETQFGTPITVLEAPFLHGVTIIEAPLLAPYTAIALTSSEIYVRNKRNPFWQPRGLRGDMVEGDWIAELGLQIVNESHHAWVSGITAFSAN